MSKIDLRQGDCIELMKDIPDKSVDMILCDLPYGTTACKWDVIIPFEPLWAQYTRVIKDNRAIVLFGTEPFSSHLRLSNEKIYKYDWVWKKRPTGYLNSKKMPMRSIENISVFYKKPPTYNPQGLIKYNSIRKNSTSKSEVDRSIRNGIAAHNGGILTGDYVQEYKNYPDQLLIFKNDNGLHPTQKPVGLLEYLIKTYTNVGGVVLDSCMGSGSTGVACVNTNRNFIGIELDEEYFEIAKERIMNYDTYRTR